ncbi:50S ribosomal protein L18 [Acidaminobacterium chupaoyuni]
MVKTINKNAQRLKRHKRVRAQVSGTAERPRLDVFRSAKHIYAQIIDDATGMTLVSASSTEKGFDIYGGNKEAAKKVGQMVAERAKAKGIEVVVFDRGGYLYHGRVKELAEGAREGGLQF